VFFRDKISFLKDNLALNKINYFNLNFNIMKKVNSVKKPNLIYLSLVILISFVFLSCGPEKDKYMPPEEESSSSTIVYNAMHSCTMKSVLTKNTKIATLNS